MNIMGGDIIPLSSYYEIEWFVLSILLAVTSLKVICYDRADSVLVIQDIAMVGSMIVLYLHNLTASKDHIICIITLTLLYA